MTEERNSSEGPLNFECLRDELKLMRPQDRRASIAALARRGASASLLQEVSEYFEELHGGLDDSTWRLLDETVGGWKIDGVLGGGGMSVVYRAQNERDGRVCALKVPRLANETCFEAVRQQAKLLQSTKLAGVESYVDSGEHPLGDGQRLPFLVTEMISGFTLAEHCARRDLGIQARGRLLVRLSKTLAELYERHSLVQCDIKDENVLVDARSETPTLIDFGISRRKELSGDRVQAFSPSTASPEQLAGEIPDHRSDIFQLALLCRRVLVASGVRLCAELETALERAMAERKEERSASAYDFCAELDAGLETQRQSERGRKRFRTWGAALLASGVIGVALWLLAAPTADWLNKTARKVHDEGRPLKAQEFLERQIWIAPSSARAHYNLAVAMDDSGDIEGALREYRIASELAEDPVPVLNNLGRVELLQGDANRALVHLEEGLRREQETPHARDHLMRLYRLHKNLGWANLVLAERAPETARSTGADAIEHLEMARQYDLDLKEADDLGPSTARGRHDAAAYCLLAQALSTHGAAEQDENGRHRPAEARSRRLQSLWRTCRDTDPHGEPEHQSWKRAAHAAL